MTTAWILPGGAGFGAIQVGAATAFLERGIVPDLIIGASVGAINAAVLAADPTLRGAARLRRLWLTTKRRDLLALRPSTMVSGRMGRANHLFGNDTLSAWLRSIVPYELIEDAALPLTITASDVAAAEAVYLRRGDVIEALLASSASPGLLPPVRIADRWLVDGWVLANAPLGWAAGQGADVIYMLPCGGTERYRTVAKPSLLRRLARDNHTRARLLAERGLPGGAAAIHQELVGALVARSIRREFLAWTPRVDIYLPPAPDVGRLSTFSFDEVPGLIARAYRLAKDWLPDARPLTAQALAEPSMLAGVND
jgi:NTE family protein